MHAPWSWLLVHCVSIVTAALVVAAVANMLHNRRSPASTAAWGLAILLIPYLGVPLYFVFGGRKLRRAAVDDERAGHADQLAVSEENAPPFDRILRRYRLPGAVAGSTMRLCPSGVEGYAALTDLIARATREIRIATFIFADDEIGTDVRDRLVTRAREGVAVRVLTDGIGSLKTARAFFDPLIAAGARHGVFNPAVRALLHGQTNLRNHRKIAIADGAVAMAGGMNITGEDIYLQSSPDAWQDLSFVVEGPVVARYDDISCSDWHHATGERLGAAADRSYASDYEPGSPGHDALLQVVPSGPDVQSDALYDVTLSGIFAARQRIWICTPYFVPDDGLVQALVIACRRGIDVRMLLPRPSNHPLSDVAGASALREIGEGIVRVLAPQL
jgi:cardiolipin synthase